MIEPQRLDPDSLQAVLVDKRVGSVLNVYGHAYPVDQWREFVRTMQEYATEKKASGIPILYGIDSNHGANYSSEGTLFPQQIGLAATWNPGLVEDLGAMAAYETRASFIPWTFSPWPTSGAIRAGRACGKGSGKTCTCRRYCRPP